MRIISILKHIIKHPLNKDDKMGAVLRFVKWQIGTRILRFPIVYNYIEGTRLIIGKGNTTLTGNIYTGMTSFEPMSFLLHYVRENDKVIDIGANAGIFTILAAGVKKANVISIEPIPETYKLLMDNIAINSLFDKIKPYNLGVGSLKHEMKFTSDMGAMNRVINEGEFYQGKSVVVGIETLDNIAADFQPNFIKLDVEGFEFFVIEGGERTLKDERCNVVIMELNGNGEKFGITDESIHKVMMDYGFLSYQYDPFNRTLNEVSFHERQEDVIYIKDVNTAKARINSAEGFVILNHKL